MLEPLLPVDPTRFAWVSALLLGGGLTAVAIRPGWVVGAPRTVLGVILAVSCLAAAVLVRPDPLSLRLSIDPSTEPLLPVGDPATQIYRRAIRDYGDDQVFVVAMETADVFTEANLSSLRRVSDRVSRLDGVRAVKSLIKVTSFRYDPAEDWLEIQPFIDDVPSDPAALRVLRARALADPLYRKNLVSEDGRAAALNVSFQRMTDREFIDADLDGAIREIVEQESRDGRRFHISGRPHIKSRMYHTMIRDLAVLIPAALGVVSIVLMTIAGSVRGVVLPLATVAVAVLWTFAGIALLERPLTILTVLLAPTLVAIGSVYGVHVVGRYEEEAARGGPSDSLAALALRHMIAPVGIAGVTTVVGFAALLITDVPAVFEIGAFSVFGVASVTLLSLTGLPAALAVLPPPRQHRGRVAVTVRSGLDRGLARLAGTASRAPLTLIAGWIVLVTIAVALLPRVVIDTDYLSFFDEDAPVRVEFERVSELLAGAVPLFVVLEGTERGRLRDPGTLRQVHAIQQRIDALPGVSHTTSFIGTLRVLNRAVAGDDPAAEKVPDTRGAVAELLFMLPKNDLQRFATIDQSSTNLVVRTGAVGSAALRALTSRIEAVLADGVPEGLEPRITGNAILLTRAADGVAESQPRTVGLAAGMILVLLTVALRSLRIGLVAMVPNVVPVLLFFGALGAGLAPLSLPTSLIGSVSLGIAIDATAHYLVRYRAERTAGATPEEAVLRTHRSSVGRAIAIASTMLCLGFLSVGFSEFATLREFGVLTAGTLAVCCFTDLLLLPAILIRARI